MTQRAFDLRHVCFEGQRAGRQRPEPRPRALARTSPSTALLTSADADPSRGLLGWVIGRAGLEAGVYRHAPLQRRLLACLRTLKVHTAQEARAILETRSDLLPTAISSLLIGVTEFFRDPVVFENLRKHVLPHLARRPGPLRIWSAGCSTGEELYSMAILLAEAGLLDRSFLLGTDCRKDAVEEASLAQYGAAALGCLAPALRERYFEAAGDFWRPVELLRRRVQWKVADLTRRIEEGPWDLILWRNMAIYLNPGPAAMVWKGLAAALAPGGFLIAGKAERPPSDAGLMPAGRCIFRVAFRQPSEAVRKDSLALWVRAGGCDRTHYHPRIVKNGIPRTALSPHPHPHPNPLPEGEGTVAIGKEAIPERLV